MQRTSSLWLGAVVAGATWLAGCADGSRVVAPAERPTFDLAAAQDAPPDSADVLVLPSDGPGHGHAWGRVGIASVGVGTASVAAPGPAIRIGVVQAATELALGSAADWTLRDKANGLVLLTGTGGSVTVTLASVAATHYRLQVTCGSTAAVATRKAAAEALGHPTFTEFVAASNCTRLYLGQFASNASFAVRNAYRNTVISQGLAASDSFWRQVTIGGGTVYRATRGATVVESVNPVVLESSSGIVTIGGKNGATTLATLSYRGLAEARQSGVAMAGINQLPIEHYLYGVVPRELGPIQYPELEAQKAQAVAARTYALAGLGKRASDGYDLRATTDDQVYGGYGAEHPVSNAAVDATAGIAAHYQGKLISALFSSTSGGHTADNEEAFNAPAAAYLRGVPDAQRGQALAHVPTLEVFRAHANPTSLRAAHEGAFESDWASLHRWSFEWSMAEISQVVSTYAGQPVGAVLAIDVTERGPSGRALRIEYVTEAGTFTDTRDHIRASLRYRNASGNLANLPSTLFFVEPVVDPRTKATTGYRVYGGGFGHGVGLSQTGAVGMAQKGHGFAEILTHYYRGVELAPGY